MFEGWDSFYLLIGGAAGALIGLLFIVVTLIRGGDVEMKLRTTGVYMTPTVAHLAMVLVLSALATAPSVSTTVDGAIFVVCALACLGFAARALMMFTIRSVQATHWSDIWAYGVGPLIICIGLAASAATAWVSPARAAWGIAASLLALLALAIRNAWDLVTWISARGDELGKS